MIEGSKKKLLGGLLRSSNGGAHYTKSWQTRFRSFLQTDVLQKFLHSIESERKNRPAALKSAALTCNVIKYLSIRAYEIRV